MGRNNTYDREIFREICEQLADSEHGSMRRILAEDERFPGKSQFYVNWLRAEPENGNIYQAAIDCFCESYAEQTIEIAEEIGVDPRHNANRIKSRQWYIEKKNRKQWGTRVDLNHGGQKGNPMAALIAEVTGTSLQPVADEGEADE